MTARLSFPRAIIFDWDDTLIDNWSAIHHALNDTLTLMGHEPWSFEKTRSGVRRSMRDSFPDLFGARWEEAADHFYTQFRAVHLSNLNILDHVPELLDWLQNDGLYLGVVSNKNGELLRQEVSHLNWSSYFSSIVGADDAVRDKPDPAPLELCLIGSGIPLEKSVWYVGDALSDMECSTRGGLSGVLIHPKGTISGDFSSFPPDLTVSNALELLDYLKLIKHSVQC